MADETSMLTPTTNRYKSLQNTVDNKRVILIANCDEISMTSSVAAEFLRAICIGDIDTDWTSSHTLDDFVHFEIFHAEHSEIAVIASGNYPVLSSLLTDSKSDYIVNLWAIEAQNHVWVYLFRLVLEVSENVI